MDMKISEDKFFEVKTRAECGDPLYMTDLGQFYLYGIGTTVDVKQGLYWAEKAAEAGDLMGLHNMGVLYLDGEFLKQDIGKAMVLFKKASDKKFGRSTNYLGVCAEKGIGMSQDYSIAKEYYEKAIEQEEWLACENLAFLYMNGTGVEQDYLKSAELFHKAKEKKAMTENGNKAFEHLLFILYCDGVCYAEGFKEKNLDKARQYIRISSFYNYLPSTRYLLLHFYVNDMLLTGMEEHNITRPFLFPQIDYIEKTKILIRAFNYSAIRETEKGIDSNDSYELCYGALLSLFGVRNFNNLSHIDLLVQSINYGCVPAIFWLGYCYEMGVGVEKSIEKAAACYSKVIQIGHTDSLWTKDDNQSDADRELAESYYRLALLYYNNKLYTSDKIKSMLSYEYGNCGFHSQSLLLIAKCLMDEGKDLNDSEVMTIIHVCAEHKNEQAQFLLGEYYYKKNGEKALSYMLDALSNGSIDAVNFLCKINKV